MKLFLTLFAASLVHASPPPRPVIYGLAPGGKVLPIPRKLCAHAGQTVRLTADTVNWKGERRFDDYQTFRWLLRLDESWYYWDPTGTATSGFLKLGPEKNSVYLRVAVTPASLSVKAFTPRGYEIEIGGGGCEWGPPEIYVTRN